MPYRQQMNTTIKEKMNCHKDKINKKNTIENSDSVVSTVDCSTGVLGSNPTRGKLCKEVICFLGVCVGFLQVP